MKRLVGSFGRHKLGCLGFSFPFLPFFFPHPLVPLVVEVILGIILRNCDIFPKQIEKGRESGGFLLLHLFYSLLFLFEKNNNMKISFACVLFFTAAVLGEPAPYFIQSLTFCDTFANVCPSELTFSVNSHPTFNVDMCACFSLPSY